MHMPDFSISLPGLLVSDKQHGPNDLQRSEGFVVDLFGVFCCRKIWGGSGAQRLPRKVVESPALEIFKTHLDACLCNLLQVTLPGQRSLTK